MAARAIVALSVRIGTVPYQPQQRCSWLLKCCQGYQAKETSSLRQAIDARSLRESLPLRAMILALV